jgi:hypothetical protein
VTYEIPPEKLVDRGKELDEFLKMLSFGDDARLLTICDEQGTGKSSLLRKLEYSCKYQRRPAVPVSRVSLDEQGITSWFSLVKRIRERMRKYEFPNFDYLDRARVGHFWSPFRPQAPGGGERIVGIVDVGGATVSGGEFAGTKVQTAGPVHVHASPDVPHYEQWADSGQEEQAQGQCIRAFLQDLRALADTQPVAILLDTFEAHDQVETLATDIVDELIVPLCVEPSRPRQFLLVLAGQELPNFEALLAGEHARVVRSRDSLTWEDEHVRDFLILHGHDQLSDADVELVCERVRNGFSIARALRLAEALSPVRPP